MPENDETPPADVTPPEIPAEPTAPVEPDPATEPEIDYKDRYEAQRKVNQDLERKLKLKADTNAVETATENARREATEAATKVANERVVRSELKLAAKGVLADPADALAFLDITQFAVDANGEVDQASIDNAIAELLTRKPHLAANGHIAFKGGGDGGASAPPKPTASLQERAATALAAGDVRSAIKLKTAQLKPTG